MLVEVNGTRLFVDVENPRFVPEGDRMREKPTLLMLHGGPGWDHAGLKSSFSALRDVAQVVYYDHRGNGRSGGDDPAGWNLAQWGDDVKGLCDALGIDRPIVCGLSFGGFVAQSYATRHPDHPAKLILLSTAAKVDFPAIFAAFGRIAGAQAASIAEDYWMNPTAEGRERYLRHCTPFYSQRRNLPDSSGYTIKRTDVALHFNGPHNEHGRMDFREDLAKLRCPVLMMAGEEDPIVPIAVGEATARCIPPHLLRFERLAGCGHNIHRDDPDLVYEVMREFIVGH